MITSSPNQEPLEEASEHLGRTVWTLAWPVVALNMLQVVNTLIDRTYVGHLPAAALTAQGASMSVMFMMFSLAMSISTSGTALVSRAFGAGDVVQYQKAARQNVSISWVGGFISAGIGALATPWVASALIPAQDVQAKALMVGYVTAYLVGLPAVWIVQSLAGALRGAGDTKSPMIVSGFQILLHIGLNSLLILPPRAVPFGIQLPGFGWGLVGAGWAMALSAWAAAIGYLAYSGRTTLGPCWRYERPERSWVKRNWAIAAPTALMSILRVTSLSAFQLTLKYLPDGSSAIAAINVGFAIESIMFMPAFGLSTAASALVGQSLGMKKPERAERVGWLAGHYGAIVVLALSLPIFVFAPNIASALVGAEKTAVIDHSTELLRWLCSTEILFSYAMIMIGAMQGAGETKRPFWITVGCLWGLRVPLAWYLGLRTPLGATGAWVALSATQAVQGLLSMAAWKQGSWKNREV